MKNAPPVKVPIHGPGSLEPDVEMDMPSEGDMTRGGLSRSKAPGISPNPSPGPCVKSGRAGS